MLQADLIVENAAPPVPRDRMGGTGGRVSGARA